LGKSLEFIRDLYKIWFIQTTGSVCPIFNDKLKLEHGTEAQNIELQVAVRDIRIALRQYLEDAQPTDDLSERCLRDLINSIQEVRKQKDPKEIQKNPQPRLPVSEKMVSEPEDIDFRKCSIIGGPQRGANNKLSLGHSSIYDEEDHLDIGSDRCFHLASDETSERNDWSSIKDLFEAMLSGDLSLQDPDDQTKQTITSKGKEAVVDIDREMT
jgi:hypothetical protein